MKKILFIVMILGLSVMGQAQTIATKGLEVGTKAIPVTLTTLELKTLKGVTTSSTLATQLDAKANKADTIPFSSAMNFDDDQLRQLQLAGSKVYSRTVGASIYNYSGVTLLDNNLIVAKLVNRNYAHLIDTVLYTQHTAANMTYDQENRIGLYSRASNGTYSLVASIANDNTLYNASSGTTVTKVFSPGYTAASNEDLYIGFLMNYSAVTAAPGIVGVNAASYSWISNLVGWTKPIIARLAAQNTLPPSFSEASLTTFGSCTLVLVK